MSYAEAMAKHYRDKARGDGSGMSVLDTESSDCEKLARNRELRHYKQDEILAKIDYKWDSSIKVWWSDELESLPLLKDSEARALADEIIDFAIREL